MVSWTRAGIALSLGYLLYLGLPFAVQSLSIHKRHPVGNWYLRKAVRALKHFAIVRRTLSGYSIYRLGVDDDRDDLLEITLDSSTLGSDKKFRFKDPDSRMKRILSKPLALAYQKVPAAIDAELAELGHAVREKNLQQPMIIKREEEPNVVDMHVPVEDGIHLVDLVDTFELVPNAVDPLNIQTAEEKTKERFNFGSNVGLKESAGMVMGYIVGAGGTAGIKYLNNNVSGFGGGGGGQLPEVPMVLFDLLVVAL